MGEQLAADLARRYGGSAGVEIAPAAMTIDQFCRWACIGKTKLYAEVKSGRITLRKIGSKTIVLRSDGEAWLNSLPKSA